jgi:hypothetical protein
LKIAYFVFITTYLYWDAGYPRKMRKMLILVLIPLLVTACEVTSTSQTSSQDNAVVIPEASLEHEEHSATFDGTSTESESADQTVMTPSPTGGIASLDLPEMFSPRENIRIADQEEYFFSQLIPYDGIRPIYTPEFVMAEDARELMQEDELVIGVAWVGEAKAYPITVLIYREMVNDELAGIPTLVTW